MRRPLICIVCVLVLVAPPTYLTALACEDDPKVTQCKTVTVSEASTDGDSAAPCTAAPEATEGDSTVDAVKSTLRAGKAVGKAVVTTAVVVATSMARAARHAAVALVTTAYSLV
jgi:hypothetical protein